MNTTLEWFVLKGENKFGPFEYPELIKMLQQKVLFPFDFVWHAGMATWTRIAEIEEFRPDQVRHLFTRMGRSKGEMFHKRAHKRKEYKGDLFVHDNLTVWKGRGFEISKGGAGVVMLKHTVLPGQKIFVHFKSHDTWPAFNATCEVVSKQYAGEGYPVDYGLRFLSLSPEVQEEFYKKVE